MDFDFQDFLRSGIREIDVRTFDFREIRHWRKDILIL